MFAFGPAPVRAGYAFEPPLSAPSECPGPWLIVPSLSQPHGPAPARPPVLVVGRPAQRGPAGQGKGGDGVAVDDGRRVGNNDAR